MKNPGLGAAVLLAVALGSLTACSSSAATISQDDLEKQVAASIAKSKWGEPTRVECPGDLTGKDGEKMRCEATFDDDKSVMTYPAYLTVTGVKDSDIAFEVEVDRRKADPSNKDETRTQTDEERDDDFNDDGTEKGSGQTGE